MEVISMKNRIKITLIGLLSLFSVPLFSAHKELLQCTNEQVLQKLESELGDIAFWKLFCPPHLCPEDSKLNPCEAYERKGDVADALEITQLQQLQAIKELFKQNNYQGILAFFKTNQFKTTKLGQSLVAKILFADHLTTTLPNDPDYQKFLNVVTVWSSSELHFELFKTYYTCSFFENNTTLKKSIVIKKLTEANMPDALKETD